MEGAQGVKHKMAALSDLPQLPESAYGYWCDYYEGWTAHGPIPEDRSTQLSLYTEEQVRAYALDVATAVREACIATIRRLRDEHCAGTHQDADPDNHCHADGSDGCDFVAAWNDAINALSQKHDKDS
jgi:hypothetical protein